MGADGDPVIMLGEAGIAAPTRDRGVGKGGKRFAPVIEGGEDCIWALVGQAGGDGGIGVAFGFAGEFGGERCFREQ